jgi:dGTPase
VRTVEILEKDGEGLNLTWEVRDGIKNHQTSSMPSTLEGKIVRFSDKIAYTYHDMDDAVRAGILKERDVPREIGEVVGYAPRERLNNFIHDIVTQSKGSDDVRMSEEVELAMKELRQFMFDRVYSNPVAKKEDSKAVSLVKTLYEHYMNHTDELPKFFVELGLRGEPREKVVCDYISSMTDRFAINLYDELYVPKFWMG